jgi:hypothetical protein
MHLADTYIRAPVSLSWRNMTQEEDAPDGNASTYRSRLAKLNIAEIAKRNEVSKNNWHEYTRCKIKHPMHLHPLQTWL